MSSRATGGGGPTTWGGLYRLGAGADFCLGSANRNLNSAGLSFRSACDNSGSITSELSVLSGMSGCPPSPFDADGCSCRLSDAELISRGTTGAEDEETSREAEGFLLLVLKATGGVLLFLLHLLTRLGFFLFLFQLPSLR